MAAGATGAIAEVDTGGHRERASSGVAEIGSAAPVPVDGRFRIGSVTKAFAAAVVLQLVAEQRLGLDDSVESVLPGVLPYAGRITIRQLLDHTSGVPEYLETLPSPRSAAFLDLRWRTWTDAELVARVADKPLLFEPGTKASYSNTNYLLLGMGIERITGKPFAAAIRDRIVGPLHLTDTTIPGTDPNISGPHPHGYLSIAPNGLVDITELNPSVMGSAGEIISTTADLNRFFGPLLDGRLLPAPLLQAMRTTVLGSKYGLGLITLELSCGVTAYGKDGDAPGYSTWSFGTPQKRITVSLTWGADRPRDAVRALLDRELCST
ncbi:serine hydrolase domain-containing protein [Nocardia brasiliensis]|uniref:serine hydrolase domain-containing protein n=1 Tax=Nocardia brasiliensis TaxID=37326 RepID=UPI003671A66E